MTCGGCGKSGKGIIDRGTVAVKGAVRMTAAEVRRRISPAWLLRARLGQCDTCDARTMSGGRAWCGEPLVETDTTCGCLCAAKARVLDEVCPRKRWPGYATLTVRGRAVIAPIPDAGEDLSDADTLTANQIEERAVE